jgi:hypothetical protein
MSVDKFSQVPFLERLKIDFAFEHGGHFIGVVGRSCAEKAKCPRFESRLVHGIFHLKDQNPT